MEVSQPFRSCEMSVWGFQMALVCQKVISQSRNSLQNGALAAFFFFFYFAAISQLRNEVHCAAKWHSCAKSWFRNCETPCGMELWLRNWKFSLFGASQPFRSYQNGGSCAAKWHSCAKLDFVAAKISTENSNELRNGLAAKCLFP